jgi:hypothetical protein
VSIEQLVVVDDRIQSLAKEGDLETYKDRFAEFYHLLAFLFKENIIPSVPEKFISSV